MHSTLASEGTTGLLGNDWGRGGRVTRGRSGGGGKGCGGHGEFGADGFDQGAGHGGARGGQNVPGERVLCCVISPNKFVWSTRNYLS